MSLVDTAIVPADGVMVAPLTVKSLQSTPSTASEKMTVKSIPSALVGFGSPLCRRMLTTSGASLTVTLTVIVSVVLPSDTWMSNVSAPLKSASALKVRPDGVTVAPLLSAEPGKPPSVPLPGKADPTIDQVRVSPTSVSRTSRRSSIDTPEASSSITSVAVGPSLKLGAASTPT